MWGFPIALALAYFAWCLRDVAIRFLKAKSDTAIAEASIKSSLARPEIPADLIAIAMAEGESWAQKEVLERIYELHEKTGDWDDVRHRIRLEAIPDEE